MQLEAALVEEQGVTFVVAVVKATALNSPGKAALARRYSNLFDGVPAVLMAQDSRGTPRYYGRPDIVRFLAKVPFQALPWKRWNVSGI